MVRILGWITLALGLTSGSLSLLVRIPDLQLLTLILAAGLVCSGLAFTRIDIKKT